MSKAMSNSVASPAIPTIIERSIADTLAARKKALEVSELAEMLGLAPTTLYDMVRNGRIPSIRIGASIRLDPKITADWLRAQSA
jgi:excisionase family DNA binding protein